MKRLIPALLVLMALTAGTPRAQDADKLFKTAMNMELVDGDLKAAIEQYQQVVKTGNRAVAAQALVRMAECYQKLGDAQSRAIYERLVRDYPDQKDAAAIARSRLGVERAPASKSMALRKVWESGNVSSDECGISPDGRYITCPAWESGDLGLHDVVTGTDRLLTTNNWAGDQFAQGSAISKDGTQVAYAWFNGNDRYELRVTSLHAPDAKPRTVLNLEDVDYVAPADWSPNGEWVAARLFRKDRTAQIGLISVKDGSLRILKTTEWSSAEGLFVSPDGKHVGFDLATDESGSERDVFVLAVDGRRETPAVVNPGRDIMMGWSADGRQLLFASDRSGVPGLWSVPISDGRPIGAAALVKSEIASASLGVTRSGALFVVARIGIVDVHSAGIDLVGGKLLSTPTSIVRNFVGRNNLPAWSRDGKHIAYVSLRAGRDRVIVIRSLATGEVREVNPALGYFGPISWAPDGRSFLVKGQGLKGALGLYQIDAQTGQVTKLPFEVPGCAGAPQWSHDGRKAYFFQGSGCPGREGSFHVEGDMATGEVREILRGSHLGNNLALSPDGRFFAGVSTAPDSLKQVSVVLAPIDGGEVKELLRLKDGQTVSAWGVSWAPDGRQVIVTVGGNTAGKSQEVLMVPIDGGTPRKLEGNNPLGVVRGVRVSPDGRQVAFSAGDYKAEIWVLENFLPTSVALGSAAK